jgi:Uma2 family endonuclease
VKKFRPRPGMPAQAIAGGSKLHSRVASNSHGHLFAKLTGSPCHPHTSDLAVRTAIDQTRFPEVTVDCGPEAPDVHEAISPVAVFEVLSPTTRGIDTDSKLMEYRRHPTIRTVVLVEPEEIDVVVYSRAAQDWHRVRYRLLSDNFAIIGSTAQLSLAEIYHGTAATALPHSPPAP